MPLYVTVDATPVPAEYCMTPRLAPKTLPQMPQQAVSDADTSPASMSGMQAAPCGRAVDRQEETQVATEGCSGWRRDTATYGQVHVVSKRVTL